MQHIENIGVAHRKQMQQIKIIGAANRSFDKTNLKIY